MCHPECCRKTVGLPSAEGARAVQALKQTGCGGSLAGWPSATPPQFPCRLRRPRLDRGGQVRVAESRSSRRRPRERECRPRRSEEHTSELQSLTNLVCRLLLEKKKNRT